MTNYDDLQKRLQRGSPQIHEANNLIAEAYGAIGALAAECERVNAELSACKEGPGTCGYWRDTARAHLAEIERLRKCLEDCSDSLHGEMLQKFGGQLPDDMHPVTRREYDRDMAEVAEYRAALSGIEPDLDTPAEAQS